MLLHDIAASFRQQFGTEPLLVRAPGRINLIGEHTDYNGGYVLPAAIDKEMYFAVALNQKNTIRLRAYDLNEAVDVATDAVAPSDTQWANYLLGVVAQLQKRGLAVPGFDCVFGGTVPAGAGLSSSAAVECGMLFALNTLLNAGLAPMEIAKLGQAAEHEYAQVLCGLMDQFASVFGRDGQVVRLDCRSLDYEYFPFDTTACHIVLCNSGVKHALASSEYNTRRQECERGVAILRQYYPETQTLRDATLEQLEAHRDELGPVVYRRCAYVVQENQRVVAACRHLAAGDLAAVGRQMYASHAGLRDDYEVSCPELDVLVKLAETQPGVYGARMMGGGFGGCTINLVAKEHVAAFVEHMKAGYQQQLGLALETYEATIVHGVSLAR
ncbi:galactokinase [Hymenobacter lucidus]|uniref:Galactokinase n=1 Tax=Hymenobacter lucidus TaxID=2880930 RepID=A0ABS8AJY5_9BACT|nr:galactokinase [Hymenobacter lucidus]MCB2406515.1 galactokinase [Hymenobacter lucidus]